MLLVHGKDVVEHVRGRVQKVEGAKRKMTLLVRDSHSLPFVKVFGDIPGQGDTG